MLSQVIQSFGCAARVSAVAFAFTLISSLQAGDWPQWLGPHRSGVADETVPEWKSFPEPVWTKSIGSGFGCPVVANGVLLVHGPVPDKEAESVLALDAVTGEEKWQDTYERAKYRSELGVGPRATPAIVDGKAYTFGITGVMSCYDMASGKRLWQTNPCDTLKTPLPTFGVCTSPLVAGDRVIVPLGGAGSAVIALNTENGEIAWQKFDEPAGTASPIAITRGDGDSRRTEVVVQTSLRLLGLDPKDGAVLWEHPIVFQPSGVAPTPLSIGDLLVCSTQDHGTMTLELPSKGQTEPHQKWWKQDLGSYFSTGTIDKSGHVYLVSNALMPLPRADIHCVDLATGDELWTKQGLGYFHVATLALSDGKLLILDDGGNLRLVDPKPEGYSELAKAKVCGGTFVSPALAHGRLYVRDAKEVRCFVVSPEPAAK